jgi:hypothetical protein
MSDLDVWVTNAPDYYDMTQAYRGYGRLKQLIILKEREIERIAEQVAVEEDKPRSNAARSRKLQATTKLSDELAELKAEFASTEAYVKSLEFAKSMFASAAYTLRMRHESPMGGNE